MNTAKMKIVYFCLFSCHICGITALPATIKTLQETTDTNNLSSPTPGTTTPSAPESTFIQTSTANQMRTKIMTTKKTWNSVISTSTGIQTPSTLSTAELKSTETTVTFSSSISTFHGHIPTTTSIGTNDTEKESTWCAENIIFCVVLKTQGFFVAVTMTCICFGIIMQCRHKLCNRKSSPARKATAIRREYSPDSFLKFNHFSYKPRAYLHPENQHKNRGKSESSKDLKMAEKSNSLRPEYSSDSFFQFNSIPQTPKYPEKPHKISQVFRNRKNPALSGKTNILRPEYSSHLFLKFNRYYSYTTQAPLQSNHKHIKFGKSKKRKYAGRRNPIRRQYNPHSFVEFHKDLYKPYASLEPNNIKKT